VNDPIEQAFKAGYLEAQLQEGFRDIEAAERAWTDYAAWRLERIADDPYCDYEDELDEPIPYRPTDVYVHATYEPGPLGSDFVAA
jgi:hypothetical protein